MIRISKSQMVSLDDAAEARFVAKMVDHLSDTGAFLRFFPAQQRWIIARNLIARARHVGLSWETSIGLFCGVALETAPNFTDHPEVRAAVTGVTNETFELRLATISEQVWEEVVARRMFAPAWLHPAEEALPDWEPFNHALSVVAWDLESKDIHQETTRTAEALALPKTLDAYLASAVAGWLYDGQHLSSPWCKDIAGLKGDSHLRLEALRARIMLDHARMV